MTEEEYACSEEVRDRGGDCGCCCFSGGGRILDELEGRLLVLVVVGRCIDEEENAVM